jgi:hypothetical protein
MYEKWKAAGASAQVLRWIKEGGYTIQVGDDGRGIFRRNSVTAREHNAELFTLVVEVLLKQTWEVVRESELRDNGNILPMGLAPKPGKTPPWRIINDGRECNEHVSPWGFRYETLKTLGLVLNPGDWMFTTDLEDAYYSMRLTEESRNLFGASLRMDKPSLKKLEEAGVLP